MKIHAADNNRVEYIGASLTVREAVEAELWDALMFTACPFAYAGVAENLGSVLAEASK